MVYYQQYTTTPSSSGKGGALRFFVIGLFSRLPWALKKIKIPRQDSSFNRNKVGFNRVGFPPMLVPVLQYTFRPRLFFQQLNNQTCRKIHHTTYNPIQLKSEKMSSKISAVSTKNAPAALSVYSQAIVANGFVYCSGMINSPTCY